MKNIKENEKLNIINHSCAHLLAQAVKHLYPNAKFWVGPVIEEGFYYDIDLGDKSIAEEDLPIIEREMKKISKDGKRIVKQVLSKEEAKEKFKNDEYKIDLINNMPKEEVISIYSQGDFFDLCRGPHVESVKELKYFKLLKVSGAYWKANSNNKMLQRIYGVCFETEKELLEHLSLLEEAKKRDHRKLGKELELFMISEYGPGFPFWLPNGLIILNELKNYWYEVHNKNGYKFIQTPIMLNKELWNISGHYKNYRENMYTSIIDEQEFAIKPMNCPGGMLVYKNSIHSYKEFPLRLGELGLVHRHEASGALAGLFRVRVFTQDDAHIFMTKSQIKEEIANVIRLYKEVYTVFNLDFTIELSTRPEEKFIGDVEIWNEAEKALAEACSLAGFDYKINSGDGAFYGPKLDFKLKDALGRIWQCGTIQLDMNLPERFDLSYIEQDGSKQRPVMVHRALFGSFERFVGVITEHFAGAFPIWLSPIQINIIPINNEFHLEYANCIKEELIKHNIRVEIDNREEKLAYKIRESVIKKIPYTIILGDKEKDTNSISYRIRGSENTDSLNIREFIYKIEKEIEEKSIF